MQTASICTASVGSLINLMFDGWSATAAYCNFSLGFCTFLIHFPSILIFSNCSCSVILSHQSCKYAGIFDVSYRSWILPYSSQLHLLAGIFDRFDCEPILLNCSQLDLFTHVLIIAHRSSKNQTVCKIITRIDGCSVCNRLLSEFTLANQVVRLVWFRTPFESCPKSQCQTCWDRFGGKNCPTCLRWCC